ncbi:MAG: riboflavin biosynthesis protein RibF [Opitutales bacterium]
MSFEPEATAAIAGLRSLDTGGKAVHLAIGMFDGVHRGHRRVIEAAVADARKDNGLACVLTFDPHPSRLFRPDDPTLLISPLPLKLELIRALGVDHCIVQPFDAAFARISASDFAAYLREALPTLRALYVGDNFRFGARRAGDVSLLADSGRALGLEVTGAPRLQEGGEPISSTRIRGLLTAGRIQEANTLLGYTYHARGEVIAGKRLGRTLGFPTLNLPWSSELRPRFGVYAVYLTTPGSSAWSHGVANYGMRPTVDGAGPPLLETHLLEDTRLGTGDTIRVEWLNFIRPEQAFDSVEALKAQIAQDVDAARTYFAAQAARN